MGIELKAASCYSFHRINFYSKEELHNMRFSFLIGGLVATLALGACTAASPQNIVNKGQYWQRASVSDAAYMQGPKAQQMLNNDIASCVSELRELERLGQLRDAIPANPHDGRVMSSDELALNAYETPERTKYLLSEYGNYHDFETCMIAKGWERVKYVPYSVAHESRKNYLKNHVDYEYRPPMTFDEEEEVSTQNDGVYNDLNE